MFDVLLHDPARFVMLQVPAAGVLAVFVTVIAYVHAPRAKLLVFSLPVPFTCAYLANSLRIDSTTLIGLPLVVLYHWCVYGLARKLHWPLGVAIALSAGAYVFTAWLLRPIAALPFLPLTAILFLLWLFAASRYRANDEPGHRSTAPWWIKLPGVFLIALTIFSAAELLAGAVATFPYAGVFTSYEMRRSLRTLAGQFTINVAGVAGAIITLYLLQDVLVKPWPLVCAWVVVLTVVGLIHASGWGRVRIIEET